MGRFAPNGRWSRGVLGAALTLLAVAGCGAADVDSSKPRDGVSSSAAALSVWVTAHLPSIPVVYAPDPEVARVLIDQGLAGVRRDEPTGLAANAPEYVVVAAPKRVRSVPLPADRSAGVVARFGTGEDLLALGVASGQSLAQVSAQVAQARQQRVQAGEELLTNPRVGVDPLLADQLTGGGLDVRAAAFLRDLSQTSPVTLVSITQDPAEASAGVGARSIVVGGASPAAVAEQARRSSLGDQPSITAVVAATFGATTTLEWPVVAP